MDYRKFYEQQTKRKVPSDFDVHHIDLNHENNDINNLVAIPKELHIEFHSTYNHIYLPVDKSELLPQGLLGKKGNGFNWFVFRQFELYYKNCEAVSEWIDYRDSLRGLIPFMNNVKY